MSFSLNKKRLLSSEIVVKIMSSHRLRSLLNVLSFPFAITFLYTLHTTKRWLLQSIYSVLFLLFLNGLRLGIETYFYIRNDQMEQFRQDNRYAYSFYHNFVGKNSLLILAGLCFLIFAQLTIHYVLIQMMDCFRTEMEQLNKLAVELYQLKFTFIDRLFDTNRSTEKAIINELAKQFKFSINPRMKLEERIALIRLFCTVEKFFLCSSIITPVITWTIFGVVVRELLTLNTDNYSLEFLMAVLATGSYMLLKHVTFITLFFCCSLSPLTLNVCSCTWFRFLAAFRKFHSSKCSYRNWLVFDKQMKYGAVLWEGYFRSLQRFNREAVCKIFRNTACITFLANVIGVVELAIGDFDARMTILLYFIFSLHFSMVSILCIVFLRSSSRLYCLKDVVLHATVQYSLRYPSKLLGVSTIWRWNCFVETLFIRKQWTFTMSPLARISWNNLLRFIPLYSAALMYVLPIVRRENALKSFN